MIPSLKIGGMERVCVSLANYLAQRTPHQIFLITLSNKGLSFEIVGEVNVLQPDFDASELSFLAASYRAIRHLRGYLQYLRPASVLSFGDRYNSLVILATLGTGIPVFVSNRMNPHLSNGKMIDWLNFLFYRFSAGIVAQTQLAKELFTERYQHQNIAVIPNPYIVRDQLGNSSKEKIILNVGRFSDQKNQHLLVRYFNQLENTLEWQVEFVGDGKKKALIEQELAQLLTGKKVFLVGFDKKISARYEQAAIFAFTSTSEGFPNALGEAMAAACAVISFDCPAGPADLIDHGVNGYLIPVGDHESYLLHLQKLMEDSELRSRFGKAAKEKMKSFSMEKIGDQYLNFILSVE